MLHELMRAVGVGGGGGGGVEGLEEGGCTVTIRQCL